MVLRRGSTSRKTTLVDISPARGWVAVLDVGGDRIRSTAPDLKGNLVEPLEVPFEGVQDEEAVTPAIQSALNEIIHKCERKRRPGTVGISSRGIVDRQQGVVKLSFNLRLRDYLVARFSVKCVMFLW